MDRWFFLSEIHNEAFEVDELMSMIAKKRSRSQWLMKNQPWPKGRICSLLEMSCGSLQ